MATTQPDELARYRAEGCVVPRYRLPADAVATMAQTRDSPAKANPYLVRQVAAAAERMPAEAKQTAGKLRSLQKAHRPAQKQLPGRAKLFG